MSEYIAAMKGIEAINESRNPQTSSGLTKNEVNDLKDFLNKNLEKGKE